MIKKLPANAFEVYLGLGDQRTYAAVARQFNVSKRAVTKRATQEKWTDRLKEIEANARTITDQRASQTLADMNDRHLAMVKAMGLRAMTALKNCQIDNGMDAVRAADMVIKLERLLAGEASKRTELSIEDVTRHEIRTLLKVVGASDEARVVQLDPGDDDETVAEGGDVP